jgi:hypothetical protein
MEAVTKKLPVKTLVSISTPYNLEYLIIRHLFDSCASFINTICCVGFCTIKIHYTVNYLHDNMPGKYAKWKSWICQLPIEPLVQNTIRKLLNNPQGSNVMAHHSIIIL